MAGVNPSNTTSGLVTKAQLTKGSWLSTNPATAKTQVLVTTAYASQKGLKVGQTLTINKVGYTIVGLVNPTLTGDVSDIYFSISNLQSLSSNDGRINEVLVSVANAKDVNGVAKAIKKELPGATVLTSASLADQVTGSLSNARKLANDLGGALAVVVLLAAFLIAGLLTLSACPSESGRSGRCGPSAGPVRASFARSWPRPLASASSAGCWGWRWGSSSV